MTAKPLFSNRAIFLCIAMLLFSMAMLMNASLQAQDNAPATGEVAADIQTGEAADTPAAADAKAPEIRQKTIIGMFKAGGWAMYPLLLLSICGLALIVYNFLAIRPGRFLRPDIMKQTNAHLVNLNIPAARKLCEETPSATTNILHAGLMRADTDDWEIDMIKEAVEEATAEELSGAYVFINYLSVIGSLAPMLGLLGTVSGMVKAFNAIAAEGVGNPQLLADNISEALITTATGMIIGIPAMFFFFFFKNKYGKITASVGRIVGDQLFNLNKAIKNAIAHWHASQEHGHADHGHGHAGHGHGQPRTDTH